MPLTSIHTPINILDNTTYWQERVVKDTATVGYYSTKLENGVTLQISGARHSGIMQYDFPTGDMHVLVDVSHYLPDVSGSNEGQFYAGGSIELHDGGKQYTGFGTYGGGFSNSAPATTYFCGEFQEAPDEANTFRGRNTDPVQRQHTLANEVRSSPRTQFRRVG
jgi:hypothetical protein